MGPSSGVPPPPPLTHESLLAFFRRASLQEVTWSHATNSKAALEQALQDPFIEMIEADIGMGRVVVVPDANDSDANPALSANTSPEEEPIMAHPPQVTSDLSFHRFLQCVLEHNKRVATVATSAAGSAAASAAERRRRGRSRANLSPKGIKLDFKEPKVVEACLSLLADVIRHEGLRCPILLNADIWDGPSDRHSPFSPRPFINQCRRCCPSAGLSLGWTVGGKEKELLWGRGVYTGAMAVQAREDLAATGLISRGPIANGKVKGRRKRGHGTGGGDDEEEEKRPEEMQVGVLVTFALHATLTRFSPPCFVQTLLKGLENSQTRPSLTLVS